MNRSRSIGMAFVVSVAFTDSGVNPETARIPATGNVRWVNAAAEYHGNVVFPEMVAE